MTELQDSTLSALGMGVPASAHAHESMSSNEQPAASSKSQGSLVQAHVKHKVTVAAPRKPPAGGAPAAPASFAGQPSALTSQLRLLQGRGLYCTVRVPVHAPDAAAGAGMALVEGFTPSAPGAHEDAAHLGGGHAPHLRVLAHSHGQYLRTVVHPRSAEKGAGVGSDEHEVRWVGFAAA